MLTHSERDRQRNPRIARDEFQLLTTLKRAGLPVAEALYLCEGHQPPFLITAFVEGSARFDAVDQDAFSRRLAEVLNSIHSLDLGAYELSFLSQPLPRPLPEASGMGDILSEATDSQTGVQSSGRSAHYEIEKAMQRALPRVAFNKPALLHGDFWPGNLLWNGGELAAIIDWEDAMLGDPLADLGKSRLEVLWALGPKALTVYTAAYLALNQNVNATALPFWDLWGAFRLSHFSSFAPAPDRIPKMRAQYEAFVADATARLESL